MNFVIRLSMSVNAVDGSVNGAVPLSCPDRKKTRHDSWVSPKEFPEVGPILDSRLVAERATV